MLTEKDFKADWLCWQQKEIPNTAHSFLDHDTKYQKPTHLYSNFICTKS